MMKRNQQSGFTLIEVVITITLLAILLIGLFSLYDGYSRIYGTQQGLFLIVNSAGTTVSEFQERVQQASQIVTQRNFGGVSYTSGTNTLILELPSIDSSGEVIDSKFDYVLFYVSGTKAFRILEADAASSRDSGTKQLSDTVSTMSFVYDSGTPNLSGSVKIDLTTQKRYSKQTQSFHTVQLTYLRNI